MLLHNKRKAVGMIMSKMDEGGKDMPPESQDSMSEDLNVLAGEVRKAISSGSDEALAQALKAFYETCDQD